MLITLYRNFQETLHTEWMGDSTSVGWFREYADIQMIFASRQPFTPVPFKRPAKPPSSLIQFAASGCPVVFACVLSML